MNQSLAMTRAPTQNTGMDFNASTSRLAIELSGPSPAVFGVYFRSVFAVPTAAALLQTALTTLDKRCDARLAAAIAEKLKMGAVHIEVMARDAMPLPERELLTYFRDGDEEISRIETSTHVAVISILNDRTPPRAALWGAIAVAEAAAVQLSGVVFDPQQNHCRKIEFYNSKLPENGNIKIIDHVSIVQSVTDDGDSWITTTGMASLGLPNLAMNGAPQNLGANLAAVLAGVAQRVVDELTLQITRTPDLQILDLPSAWKVQLSDLARASDESVPPAVEAGLGSDVLLTWSNTNDDADDAMEPMIEVAPGRRYYKNAADESSAYYEFLHELLGVATANNTKLVAEDDAAIARATAQAKAELPEMKERFAAGFPSTSKFFIKKGFEYDGGFEYMWIFVSEWRGEVIGGTIANDPVHRADLKVGTAVECKESDVIDWLLAHDDGRLEGAYTNR